MNNHVKDGGPASPTYVSTDSPEHVPEFDTFPGMSLRDWFAGQLAAAELASAGAYEPAAIALAEGAKAAGMTIEQRIAFNAYRLADAMLHERGQQ